MITNGIAICTDEKFPLNEEKHVHSLPNQNDASLKLLAFTETENKTKRRRSIDRQNLLPFRTPKRVDGRRERAIRREEIRSTFYLFFLFFSFTKP